jgi:hypothetical protein
MARRLDARAADFADAFDVRKLLFHSSIHKALDLLGIQGAP